jgi:hypothetical protein
MAGLLLRAQGSHRPRAAVLPSCPVTQTPTIRRGEMKHSIAWGRVTDSEVVRALKEYDQLGPERFFAEHGFGPTTTYDLVWNERVYPPKAILGTAYEFATGERLASGDFEGGKSGAVTTLGKLGFTVQGRRSPTFD